ncbi:hypothetical protein SNEBB_003165 [Seison nebaliae]|nr:hypothetical protein SNEBB_003165 [Seison nebaliae]
MSNKVGLLKEIATRLRYHSVQMTQASNSGHPTSCSSMAEMMSVLFFNEMKFDVQNPDDPNSDRFVLSKGHAAPILYAAWAELGSKLISVSKLSTLRQMNSILEGHPMPQMPFVDVATGSLGQGLSAAAGMAYSAKYIEKSKHQVYCLIGDGESAEGGIWEALSFSSTYKLNNLRCLIDVNRLGQSAPTALAHDMEIYRKRFDAFGWNAIIVDGHSVEELLAGFEKASKEENKPTMLICKTFKGRDFPKIEDELNFHGKALGDRSKDVLQHLKKKMVKPIDSKFDIVPKNRSNTLKKRSFKELITNIAAPPAYKMGDSIATRQAYGAALAKLGDVNNNVIALDADMNNSTFSAKFQEKFPARYVECFIAEQNMVGVAVGIASRNRSTVFLSTFAAFLTRAFDHIRMAAVSQSNINIAGSHAGCSIGPDGVSQMALEDLAMFRSIPTATVFYPSDAVSTEKAVELAGQTEGICYIRLTRANTNVVHEPSTKFEIGKAIVVRSTPSAKMLIIAAAVTLTEAVKAAEKLAVDKIDVAIIDPFTVKPIDKKTILETAKKSGNKILTVEDHYRSGGIGEAVASALADETDIKIKMVCVTTIPHSGTPEEVMSKAGIDEAGIIAAVKSFI